MYQNEIASKEFIKKFNYFTNDKFDVRIKWVTRKIRTLFQLKNKSLHPTCKIYEGTCKSNPAKQLPDHINHSFTLKIICKSPKSKLARKILEAYFIGTMKPSLNDQIDSDLPHLLETVLHNIKLNILPMGSLF